jgi:hypothetical protein
MKRFGPYLESIKINFYPIQDWFKRNFFAYNKLSNSSRKDNYLCIKCIFKKEFPILHVYFIFTKPSF